MTPRRFVAAGAAAALTTAGLTLASAPASAESVSFEDARADIAGQVDSEMLAAMIDEFEVSASEVYDRLATDTVAADIEDLAERQFEQDYAGTWVSETGDDIVVAVTDPGLADDVERLGGTARIVDSTLADLDADMALLDAAEIPDEVYGWSIDVVDNTIAVTAESRRDAVAFAGSAGLSPADIDVEISSDRPTTTYENLRGGEAYYIPAMGYRCSIGFSVWRPGNESGFVTAGHCGHAGQHTNAKNIALGVFQGSVFPGGDYAYVDTNSEWAGQAWVTRWNGTDAIVRNSNEAPIGAWVCRSGSTSGWNCGSVQAKGVTVNYADGPVYGMTQTSACADGGDSGGPFITGGGSAQGVTSGGSGGCGQPDRATTFFYPINPILDAYDLTLITA